MNEITDKNLKPYDNKFDHSQSYITFIVNKILRVPCTEDIDVLTVLLISAVEEHLENKRSCQINSMQNHSSCLKRIIIEETGLKLIKNTLKTKHTTEILQKIVLGWFRDNFWMIEAECLRCGK